MMAGSISPSPAITHLVHASGKCEGRIKVRDENLNSIIPTPRLAKTAQFHSNVLHRSLCQLTGIRYRPPATPNGSIGADSRFSFCLHHRLHSGPETEKGKTNNKLNPLSHSGWKYLAGARSIRGGLKELANIHLLCCATWVLEGFALGMFVLEGCLVIK